MKVWRERLQLTAPLLEARLTSAPHRAPAAALPPASSLEEIQEAYARGRAEAETAFRAELERQRAEFARLQSGILQSLRNSVAQVARDCEGTLVALAFEIATKLVAGTPITAEQVETAVREVIGELQHKTAVLIRLHPEDLALLQATDSPLLQPVVNGEQVTFEAVPEITRGGCLVSTSFGTIDGRVETRRDVLRETLLG